MRAHVKAHNFSDAGHLRNLKKVKKETKESITVKRVRKVLQEKKQSKDSQALPTSLTQEACIFQTDSEQSN